MGTDLQLAPMERQAALTPDAESGAEVFHMRHGGGGAATRFVCGYLALSRSVFRPLLEALPRLICIPMGDGPAAAMLQGALPRRRARVVGPAAGRGLDARQAGGAALRRGAAPLRRAPAARRHGWLAGVRDAHVGRALALLHAAPGRHWTVDALAREAALSRSALAERFTALVGESPIQYLMRWRLALAAQGAALGRGRDRPARRAQRLRVRGGVQPRVQARVRRAARGLAQGRDERA
jgi:hypothetical protein